MKSKRARGGARALTTHNQFQERAILLSLAFRETLPTHLRIFMQHDHASPLTRYDEATILRVIRICNAIANYS